MQRFSYEQWKKMSQELTRNKEVMEQLSKLYIVAHEKVKIIIRKCQTDFNYDPYQQTEKQLSFIKLILQKLANKTNDEYLSVIDPNIILKYEKHFEGLIQLLRIALMTHNNQSNIHLDELRRISEDKNLGKQFSLKSQVKKSEKRLIRTKSGHRITKSSKSTKINGEENENLFVEVDEGLDKEKLHIDQYQKKKSNLEKMINDQIEKSKDGLSVNFKKKYLNLDTYLTERKELADLYFCQEYFDAMIAESQSRKNQVKANQKQDVNLYKIFPQFNIKTKHMKKQVRQNILQVIFQVKKQLLKEFHDSNVAKMAEAGEKGAMKIDSVDNKKAKVKSSSNRFNKTSFQDTQCLTRFKSTNRLIKSTNGSPKFRKTINSMKDIRTTAYPTKNNFWPEQQSEKIKNKFVTRFSESKFKTYGKQYQK